MTHRFPHDTLLDSIQTREQDLNRWSVQLHPLHLWHREPLLWGDPPRAVVELIEPRDGVRPNARALALEHELPSRIDPAICVPPDVGDCLHERDVALLDDLWPPFVPTRQAGDELDLKWRSVSHKEWNWEGDERTLALEKFHFRRISSTDVIGRLGGSGSARCAPMALFT
jgi:hypothetical protein